MREETANETENVQKAEINIKQKRQKYKEQNTRQEYNDITT